VDPLRRLTWTHAQFYQSYTAFFDAAIESYKKHFSRWKEPGLLSYTFAGDSKATHALARWVVDSSRMPHPNESYKLETHGGREINLHDFVSFCTEKTTLDELCSTHGQLPQTAIVRLNMFAIAKLASPSLPLLDICSTNDPVLTKPCIHCEQNVLLHASSTHPVEACIRRPLNVPLPVAAKKIVPHLRCNGPLQLLQ
jgi:hypothetical protein